MGLKNKRTIVSSKYRLSNYPIKHIDQPSLELLSTLFVPRTNKGDWGGKIISLFDAYLGVTGQKISFLSLSRKSINKVFAGFYGALNSDVFISVADITLKSYKIHYKRAVKALAERIPAVEMRIDEISSDLQWEKDSKNPLEIEYYQAWLLKGKHGKEKLGVRLPWFWNHFGPELTRKVHKGALKLSVTIEENSQGNFLSIINGFLSYVESEQPDSTLEEFQSREFTTVLIDNFCRSYFQRSQEQGRCLETSIKRWNDARPYFESAFFDSGAFAKPWRDIPYIEPNRKSGSETNIKKNGNNIEVKDKLLVDVPLQVTDDEAIELIFKKIDQHIATVTKWAKRVADEAYANNQSCEVDTQIFDRAKGYQKRNLILKPGSKIALADLAWDVGMPTSYMLEPFMYLLIKEHPKITEAFLLGLELYDKNGKLTAIEETDNCTYLVGYKKRKGGDKALQRIKLNNESRKRINQVLEITKVPRKYLKSISNDNYRFFFLSTGFAFNKPTKVTTVLDCYRASLSRDRRIAQLIQSEYGHIDGLKRDCNLEQEVITDLMSRLSMTKFRATVAVQIFLETKSAKKMAEELGHERYKPELLSHYLPEPLLQFFQSRWVRIFQKGIICEAMKDTPYQLRASSFSKIEELDEFLNNHALKLPELDKDADKTNISDVLVSVDEDILTALLSLESAVLAAPKQEDVTAKAIYWSKFSQLITAEIESNRYDHEIKSALENAKMNKDLSIMQGIIYA